MGMAAANLSLAYLLTEQDHYLTEAKRWIFTAVDYEVWGYGFLVDVDLSASFDLNCKGIHNVWRDVPESAIAEIEAFSEEDGYIYAIGESSRLYYPEMKLTRNARHIINS